MKKSQLNLQWIIEINISKVDSIMWFLFCHQTNSYISKFNKTKDKFEWMRSLFFSVWNQLVYYTFIYYIISYKVKNRKGNICVIIILV
jgi:hypothetical protein